MSHKVQCLCSLLSMSLHPLSPAQGEEPKLDPEAERQRELRELMEIPEHLKGQQTELPTIPGQWTTAMQEVGMSKADRLKVRPRRVMGAGCGVQAGTVGGSISRHTLGRQGQGVLGMLRGAGQRGAVAARAGGCGNDT